MSFDSNFQQFAAATERLVGSGSVKDRLFAAYQNELSTVDVDALPNELRADYLRWHDSLHRVRPLRGEHAVRATLNRLSGAEADRIAQNFVQISLRMMRHVAANKIDFAELRAPLQSAAVVKLFPS